MKIKKRMTSKAISANQNNSKKSPGPTTQRGKRNSSVNRSYVRLLARTLNFGNGEEEMYDELLDTLIRDYGPEDMVQTHLIKEVADSMWKLQQTSRWEAEAVRCRRASSRAVMKALAADTTTILGPSLPLVNDTTLSSTIDGWDCSEFSLSCHRSGNTKEEGRVFGNKATGDHVGVEARLASSLDTAMRYRSMLKRDLHRAIAELERQRAARMDAD